ncbi:molybdopterin-dependent oxidoreductase [Flexivirga meconopsidis]|uniref:molybdopterin-dependent oxidoreductase n=1 Tax=Flexivirga meconopsidis TaxID=2977121 RepID=UPI00223F5860|nr:molybdopterin-dependent oxidoreductase [Flexivirga meconopsidis]
MTDERPSLLRAGVIGLLSVGVGLAAGGVVAALGDPATSPVLAVGSEVIDRTPTPVKDWAIEHFGTHDKLILLSSVTVAVLIVAIASGLLARSRLLVGVAVQVLMLLVAGYAVLARPFAALSDLLPTVCAGVVSLAALVGLFRVTARPAGSAGASRRTFVAATGGTAALATLGVVGGRAITSSRSAIDVKLPAADAPAPALPAGLDRTVPGVTPLRTPNSSFYRVDTELSVPNLSASDWELTIDGDVENPYTISYSELLRRPLTERNITITCVSNPVGGKYAGGATWRGVLLKDLLAEARVKEPNRPDLQVLSTSFNGFTISTPLGAMTDDRGAMLAIGMNGAPLPRAHGFPARLITPGLYGMLGCTKWVTKLTVTTYADRKAYWTKRGWTTEGEIKPTARIDVPAALASVKPGRVLIGGTAWAQRRGVVAVQVSIDGGPWTAASLGPDVNVDYWRQWYYAWETNKPGQHSVRARVIYGDNMIQTAARAGVFPSGSSGIEERVFLVG